jgi:hypothetical protein
MILWGGGKALILAPKYGENSYIYIVMSCLFYIKFGFKMYRFELEIIMILFNV